MRIEIRTTPEEKRRWQEIAENKGVSLSELVRSALGGQRLRKRREPPRVDPDLLRELARMGNNLNQLARAANRRQPVPAAALLVRLIEIDRELSALRAAHERPADFTDILIQKLFAAFPSFICHFGKYLHIKRSISGNCTKNNACRNSL